MCWQFWFFLARSKECTPARRRGVARIDVWGLARDNRTSFQTCRVAYRAHPQSSHRAFHPFWTELVHLLFTNPRKYTEFYLHINYDLTADHDSIYGVYYICPIMYDITYESSYINTPTGYVQSIEDGIQLLATTIHK